MSKISKLLQVPVFLLLVASVVAGWYAASKGIQGITYGAPIILTLIIIAYVIGRYLDAT